MNLRRSEIGLKLHKSLWRFLNVHAARINLGTVSGAEHRLCGAAPVTCALAMVFRLDGDDDALGYLDRLGERRNVERARVDCSYRVIKARSEEHTSEITSLMSTSYAVFCLKKQRTSMHHNLSYFHTL